MKAYAPPNKRQPYGVVKDKLVRAATKGAARKAAQRSVSRNAHRCLRCGAGHEWIE